MIASSSEVGLFDVAQLWAGRQTITQGDASVSGPCRRGGFRRQTSGVGGTGSHGEHFRERLVTAP